MAQSTSTRFVAGFLLSVLASTLAACGMAPAPMVASPGYGTGIMARKAAPVASRRFGLTFDRQTTKVKFVSGGVNSGLPAKTDLRSKLSPVDDQGEIGACTGFAITGLAEYRNRLKGNSQELSPGFVYLLELKAEKHLGQDEGARLSTGMKILQKNGIAPEALHPFLTPADQQDGKKINEFLSALPSPAAMKAALPNRVSTIKPVTDINSFKSAIAKGNPVVFGIAVYSSFDADEVKKTGVVPLPNEAQDGFMGGHAILAVGYDDAKQQVIFRNSWNTTWGDKGYGYLPYSYFKKELVGDAWQAS